MFVSCGALAQTALQPALPCPSLDLSSSQSHSASDSLGREAAAAPPQSW